MALGDVVRPALFSISRWRRSKQLHKLHVLIEPISYRMSTSWIYLALINAASSIRGPKHMAAMAFPVRQTFASRYTSALGFRRGYSAIGAAFHSNDIPEMEEICTSADVTETIRLQSKLETSILIEKFAKMQQKTPQIQPPTVLSTSDEVSQYIDNNIDAIMFDCDGVLYRGSDPIPNAAAALSDLTLGRNKKVFFVTNNAGSNREQLRDKLAGLLRMDSLEVEQMVTSSYSAARYLQRELPYRDDGQKPIVHVIGTSGLCDEIASMGFTVQGGPSVDPRSGMTREELASYPFPEQKVDALVVGLDNEFDYRKLCIANVNLQRNPCALFIATNEDAYDLVGVDARHLPGNGALVKALEHASQRKAVCVGKPSPLLAELIAADHGLDPARTLFVGDRLDTDIRFGNESMMQSALVMTGCTTAEKVLELCGVNDGRGTKEEPMPTVIFPHMGMMGYNML